MQNDPIAAFIPLSTGTATPRTETADPLATIIPDQEQERTDRLRAPLALSTVKTPEDALRNLALGNATGTTPEFAGNNREYVTRQAEFSGFALDRIVRDSPRLADLIIGKPQIAPAIRDDLDGLGYFEKWYRDWKQAGQTSRQNTALADIGVKRMLGADLSPEDANILALSRQQPTVDYGIGPVASVPIAVREMLGPLLDAGMTAGKAGLVGAGLGIGIGAAGGGPLAPLGGVLGGVAGFGAVAEPAFLMALAMQSAGLAYNEFADMKDATGQPIDHDAAVGASLTVGAVSGMLQRFAIDKVVAQIPGGKEAMNYISRDAVQAALRSGTATEAFKRIGVAVAKVAGSGGKVSVTNALAGGLQSLTMEVAAEFLKTGGDPGAWEGFFGANAGGGVYADGTPEQKAAVAAQQQKFQNEILGKVAKAAERAGEAGFGMGAGARLIGTLGRAAIGSVQYSRDQAALDAALAAARENKTAQRDPGLFASIIAEQLPKDMVVYMDAGKAAEFFQSSKGGADRFAEFVPEARDQLPEASAMGGDIVLPASRVIAMWAKTNEFDALKGLMRLTPESLSTHDYTDEIARQMGVENQEPGSLSRGEEMQRNVEQQLMDVGHTPDVARQQSGLWRAFYETMADRLKGSDAATSMLDKMFQNVRITRELPPELESANTSMLDVFIDKARNVANQRPRKSPVEGTPYIDALLRKEGVRVGSPLSSELGMMDITPRSAPGLFRRGSGVADLDAIGPDSLPGKPDRVKMDTSNTRDAAPSYVDPAWLLEQIDHEWRNRKNEKPQDATPHERFNDALFHDLGIDIKTASNGEIKAAIDAYRAGRKLDQPGENVSLKPGAQSTPAPVFFSALKQAVSGLTQGKATAQQWKATIANLKGVKKEEIEWLGVQEWLDGFDRPVTKEELVRFIDDNQVRLYDELQYGDEPEMDVEDHGYEVLEPAPAHIEAESENWLEPAREQLEAEERNEGGDPADITDAMVKERARSMAYNDYTEHPEQSVRFSNAEFGDFIVVGSDEDGWSVIHDNSGAEIGRVNKPWQARVIIEKYVTDNWPKETLGGILASGPTSYGLASPHDVTLPGGKDYAELLIALDAPDRSFRQGHFGIANLIAHVRFDERVIDGKRTLFLQEVQSDWHQQGRDRGYAKGSRVDRDLARLAAVAKHEDAKAALRDLTAAIRRDAQAQFAQHLTFNEAQSLAATGVNTLAEMIGKKAEFDAAVEAQNKAGDELTAAERLVPDAPFKSSWAEVAMKRMIRWAVDNGFEAVAWTTGRMQSDRYNSALQAFTNFRYRKNDDGTWFVSGEDRNRPEGQQVIETTVDDKKLNDTVGVEIAERMRTGAGHPVPFSDRMMKLPTELLTVSDKGMTTFYDGILPSFVRKYTSKWGATVGMGELQAGPNAVHMVDVTPAMKDAALRGQPLFQDNRGSIRFTPERSVISLTENADLSTFLHESGHFFLETLRAVVSADGVPLDVVKDYGAISDWLGLKNPLDEPTVNQHEQFARGFEAYLMEGKAPSGDLVGPFRRFKAWLTRIYKGALALNVTLTDSVRGVFDRLLASSEAIDAQRNSPLFRPDENIMAMLTPAEKAQYVKRGNDAVAASKDRLFRKLLSQKNRETQDWWKTERTRAYDEVARQVNESAIYKAVHFLQTGEFLGEPTPNGAPKGKLDRKTLTERYGKELIPYLPRGAVERGKGGLDPEMVASLFGFTSADDMVHAMVGLEERKAKIERLTDETMFERHGDALRDGTIEREATDAMMSMDRGDAIAYELQTIGRQTGQKYPTNTDFRRAAESYLANKTMDDATRPNRFYLAEVKWAQKAGRALQRKDFKRAADFKRKQLMNHHLYLAASAARDEMTKALRRFGALGRKQARGKVRIDPAYHDKILEVLDLFNFGAKMSARKRTALEMQAMFQWIQRREENDTAQLEIPPELRRADQKQHFRDLTLEEFRAVRDMVLTLATQGRLKNKLIVQGKARDLKADAEAAAAIIRGNIEAAPVPVNPHRDDTFTRAKRTLRGWVAASTKAATYIERMDGGDKGGYVHQRLRQDVRNGEVSRVTRLRAESASLDKIVQDAYKGEDIGSQKTAKFIPEIGDSLRKDEMLAVALNWGNEGNRAALLGGGIKKGSATEDQVAAILDKLDKRDWDFVQSVWDYIDKFWPEIAALERRRSGYAPVKVEAAAVHTKFGDYAGGYYPLRYDPLKPTQGKTVAKSLESLDAEWADVAAGRYGSAQTARGHTIERQKGVKRAVQLTLDTISRHVNRVVTDLTMGEAVTNSWKFLTSHDVKSAIDETLGTDVHQDLQVWLKDVAVGSIIASDAMSSIARNIRVGVTIGAMGWKLATVLTQPAGYAQSIVELRPKWAMAGLFKMMAHPVESIRTVQQMSPFMRSRSTSFHRDVMDSINALAGKGAITKLQQSYFWAIVKVQMTVDTATWLGAHERAMSEGATDAEAVERSDLFVESSQSSGFMSSLSPVERGTVSVNARLSEGWKLWTTFYSYFNAKLNVALKRAHSTDFSKPGEVASLAADYITMFWVEAALANLFTGHLPALSDDKDKLVQLGWWTLKGGLQSMGATIPFVSGLASSLAGYDAAPAVARGLEDVAGGIKATGKALAAPFTGDDVDWLSIIKAIVTGGNIVSPVHYPAGQINIAVDALQRRDHGREVGPGNFLLYVPKR